MYISVPLRGCFFKKLRLSAQRIPTRYSRKEIKERTLRIAQQIDVYITHRNIELDFTACRVVIIGDPSAGSTFQRLIGRIGEQMIGQQLIFFRIVALRFIYKSHHARKLGVIINLSTCRTGCNRGSDATSHTERKPHLHPLVTVYSLQVVSFDELIGARCKRQERQQSRH